MIPQPDFEAGSPETIPPDFVPGNGHFRIPVEWHEEHAFPVQIVHFDFAHLDSYDDQLREALRAGTNGPGTARRILGRIIRIETERVAADTISRLICLIIDAKKPVARILAIAQRYGLFAALGKTGTQLAAERGISKQAMQQAQKWVDENLGATRKNRSMRDQNAREKMRQKPVRGRASRREPRHKQHDPQREQQQHRDPGGSDRARLELETSPSPETEQDRHEQEFE